MSASRFQLGEDTLDAAVLVHLAEQQSPNLIVSTKTRDRVIRFREIVEEKALKSESFYGLNTGFGYLSNVKIDRQDLRQLQLNLVRSHACGVGEPIDPQYSRALLILRAHTFLLGHSGISYEVIELILALIRYDILPVIPCQGSVGASGDLAPLAHLAEVLLGEGEVYYEGQRQPSSHVFEKFGLVPIKLGPKEGLSLINGTHFMSALAAFAVVQAKRLAVAADYVAGLSLDASRGTIRAFDSRVHAVRAQVGQQLVAEHLRSLFDEQDEIIESHRDCDRVQDPYSFRCVPQVHGAIRDAIAYVEQIVTRELNSVTDNPLVFEDGEIISGGNFHGQPVAMAMDFLAIAVAELGSISEQRIQKLINPQMNGGLPAFLTKRSGLNSGFMIPQVVAASLVSENKVLAHPASVDSIPTSADKEDHVSMGPIAARKALDVSENVSKVLAVEGLAAAQGIDLLAPLKPGVKLSSFYDQVRNRSKSVDQDRSLSHDITNLGQWFLSEAFAKAFWDDRIEAVKKT